jgi:hypothetical protein
VHTNVWKAATFVLKTRWGGVGEEGRKNGKELIVIISRFQQLCMKF